MIQTSENADESLDDGEETRDKEETGSASVQVSTDIEPVSASASEATTTGNDTQEGEKPAEEEEEKDQGGEDEVEEGEIFPLIDVRMNSKKKTLRIHFWHAYNIRFDIFLSLHLTYTRNLTFDLQESHVHLALADAAELQPDDYAEAPPDVPTEDPRADAAQTPPEDAGKDPLAIEAEDSVPGTSGVSNDSDVMKHSVKTNIVFWQYFQVALITNKGKISFFFFTTEAKTLLLI